MHIMMEYWFSHSIVQKVEISKIPLMQTHNGNIGSHVPYIAICTIYTAIWLSFSYYIVSLVQ